MGLDMYFVARKSYSDKDEIPVTLHYWRKHNALHAWFEDRWNSMTREEFIKNGKIPEDIAINMTDTWWMEMHEYPLNRIPVFLSKEILIDLWKDIEEETLKPKEGFFFGSTEYNPAIYKEDDINAVNKAIEAINQEQIVAYDCWW